MNKQIKNPSAFSHSLLKKGDSLKKQKAFTLVELIIVITILAILATIAFVSFQGYTKTSRDSHRITTLSNIEKGLVAFQITSGKYPVPDEKINITDSGTVIGYQGLIGENVTRIIKISSIPKDPQDQINYIYSRNEIGDKYQIMGFLEVQNSQTAFIKESYADVSKRFPIIKGDKLGIILGENNNPVQTNIDIRNYSGSTLTTYLTQNENISGTGEILKTLISNFKTGKTWRELDPNCYIDDIVIGNQIWAGCNSTLGDGVEFISNNVFSCYNYNGTQISCGDNEQMQSTSKENVWTATSGVTSRVNNIWGKLYLWNNSPSACPEGWKVPSDEDFKNLERYLGCSEGDINRENTSGCSGLGWQNAGLIVKKLELPLSGFRAIDGSFRFRGYRSALWSSTSIQNNAYSRNFGFDLNSNVFRGTFDILHAANIRCIKN